MGTDILADLRRKNISLEKSWTQLQDKMRASNVILSMGRKAWSMLRQQRIRLLQSGCEQPAKAEKEMKILGLYDKARKI